MDVDMNDIEWVKSRNDARIDALERRYDARLRRLDEEIAELERRCNDRFRDLERRILASERTTVALWNAPIGATLDARLLTLEKGLLLLEQENDNTFERLEDVGSFIEDVDCS